MHRVLTVSHVLIFVTDIYIYSFLHILSIVYKLNDYQQLNQRTLLNTHFK